MERDSSELRLRVGHTADFAATELDGAYRLLERVFEGDITADDWEHGLGGVHVMAFVGPALVGHASVIQRRLLYRGSALRTGYVEAVGVHPDFQRRGIGGRMMDALESIIARAFDLGALGASDIGAAFYRKRSWRRWQGQLFALTPGGVRRTAGEEGGVYVLPVTQELDLAEPLTADFRGGDVW